MRNLQISSFSCHQLIVFYLSFFSFLLGQTTSTTCLKDQKLALLALKSHLTFNPSLSTKLSGWNQTVECCDWAGVTCDEAGHVTRLDLTHETLTGPIPSSPSHWTPLHSLQFLSMAYNSLTGPFPKSLLLNLPSIDDLNLSNNKLSGQIPNVTPSNYRLLRNLDLSNNMLSGPIPEVVFKLSSISTLSLSFNKLTGVVDLHKIEKLTELYSLELSNNDLTVTNAGTADLSSLSKLNSLILSSCKLKDFPDLKNQSRLMMIDLSDNELSGEIPSAIWEVGNGFLRFLNVSGNKLTGLEKPYTFPFLLDVLDLHSNYLKGEIPVPPRRVYHLDYSNNRFQSSIPVGFGNVLRSTLFFSIAKSKVVGVIPESMRNASSLRVLDLAGNELTGPIPLIGNMKDLESLDVSVNRLSGRIPEELTNLTRLSFLNVSYNELSGRIPRFEGRFTESSFEGNEGLCGPPLKKSCGKGNMLG